MKRIGLRLPHLSLVLTLASGCSEKPAQDGAAGSCELAPDLDTECTGGVDGGTAAGVFLQAYACTGSARPDDSPKYIDGVPQGLVCSDQGAPDGGPHTYCCTVNKTTCAYNPIAVRDGICDQGTDGFQCWGSNRPESLNPELQCGQGVMQGDYINYCCAHQLPTYACQARDYAACPADRKDTDPPCCSSQTAGFSCDDLDALPRAELLGSNKSRADNYYFLCPTPTPIKEADGGLTGRNFYCCIVSTPMPEGGSCVMDTRVPGCAPGRFGFACYGRDRPDQDFISMSCPEEGFPGVSAEGYPATLYCCDFKPTE